MADALIALKHTGRKMAAFNLDQVKITRKVPVIQVLKNGTSVGVIRAHRLPDSITFLAKERKYNLPGTLLECTEIKKALEDGRLRQIEQPSKPDPKPQTKSSRRRAR